MLGWDPPGRRSGWGEVWGAWGGREKHVTGGGRLVASENGEKQKE